MAKIAALYKKLGKKSVQCILCSHRCRLNDTELGICAARQNIDGELFSIVYGKVIAQNPDPVEKKPLYHFLPGSMSYSIAAPGCNFRCGFCQNWQISQLRSADNYSFRALSVSPETIVKDAINHSCASISYTYTEPTIFFELASETAAIAKSKGLKNIFVTNGFMTLEAIDEMKWLDAANIDLKSFSNDFYKSECKGRLAPVLDSIKYMKKKKIWIEITTLLIPGKNDSDNELKSLAEFIASVDRDIPWHISRFHPRYEYLNFEITPITLMRRARDLGRQAGLRYVYLGNVSGDSSTYCPVCEAKAVSREAYSASSVNIKNSKCSSCGTEIPGVWE
jgi:pyruvate formate lyase activating enzyme